MAKGKYCASRRCKNSVSKGGGFCSKHMGATPAQKKTQVKIKKKTYKISDVDPIYEYDMSDSLKEETLNLRNYYVESPSTRYRVVDDFANRPDVKVIIRLHCERVFDYLKNLPGSVISGRKADRYEIFHWGFINAPPHSRKAGTTHVDIAHPQSHKVYSVWIPIDNVTAKNGCVTMFLKSQGTPIDYRKPNQDSKFEKRILTGNVGKIIMFDGRIHHRSEANETDRVRTILLFGLKLKTFRVQDEKGKEFVDDITSVSKSSSSS